MGSRSFPTFSTVFESATAVRSDAVETYELSLLTTNLTWPISLFAISDSEFLGFLPLPVERFLWFPQSHNLL